MFGGGLGNAGTLDLSDLDGSYGFVMNAIAEGHGSGRKASSAADVNGDDVADLIIGARAAKPNGIGSAGQSHVGVWWRRRWRCGYDRIV